MAASSHDRQESSACGFWRHARSLQCGVVAARACFARDVRPTGRRRSTSDWPHHQLRARRSGWRRRCSSSRAAPRRDGPTMLRRKPVGSIDRVDDGERWEAPQTLKSRLIARHGCAPCCGGRRGEAPAVFAQLLRSSPRCADDRLRPGLPPTRANRCSAIWKHLLRCSRSLMRCAYLRAGAPARRPGNACSRKWPVSGTRACREIVFVETTTSTSAAIRPWRRRLPEQPAAAVEHAARAVKVRPTSLNLRSRGGWPKRTTATMDSPRHRDTHGQGGPDAACRALIELLRDEVVRCTTIATATSSARMIAE